MMPTKNSVMDVHNHLMARLEELGDEEKTDEEMQDAIARAEASVKVAGAIVENQRVVLNTVRFMAEQGVLVTRNDFPALPKPDDEPDI